MENKEIRNILLENIKNELKDFTQVQRNLKKSVMKYLIIEKKFQN